MKNPLERTVGEWAALVESIRSDCARTAATLLRARQPEVEALNDLAALDEALARAQESVANVCSVLLVRQQLRQLRAAQTSSGNT